MSNISNHEHDTSCYNIAYATLLRGYYFSLNKFGSSPSRICIIILYIVERWVFPRNFKFGTIFKQYVTINYDEIQAYLQNMEIIK